MPILASSMYVNAYGKAAGLVTVTTPQTLDSVQASQDTYVAKYDSSGKAIWTARVASTLIDTGFGIATDSGGNVYVTGQSGVGVVVTAYNSDGSRFVPNTGNSGSNDAFIIKYNTNGIVQWVARVGSTGVDIGYSIATDSSGNVYVTGQGGSSVTVTAFSSNGVAFGTTLPSSSNLDVFIVKYDTSGIVQWVAKVGSTGADIGYAIATDSGGNVYITGQGGSAAVVTAFSSNGAAFSPKIANAGSNDMFIVKYNTSGIVQWVARVASTLIDIGFAITTDSGGNVYVTGQGGSGAVVTAFSSDGVAFGTTLPNAGSNDAFIVKYNTSGIVQWVARVASTGADIGRGIRTDSSGNVYVTGQGGSAAVVTAFSSNGVAFGTTLPNAGGNDAFIVKYDTSGIVQWVARVVTTGDEIGFAIATDSGGNVYVTGQGGVGVVVTAFSSDGVAFGTTLTNSGGGDAFIVKYNTSGIVQWVTRLGSSGIDIGRGLIVDSNSNIYTTGNYTGSRFAVYGQSISLFSTILNSGGADAFIVKYNTNGAPQWVARVASAADDQSRGISTDSSGNAYVVGDCGAGPVTAFSSNGVAFGTTLVNSGGGDAFIVKYNTSGIVQWVAKVASIGIDFGYAIATDSGANLYITGRTGNTAFTAFSSDGVAFGTTLTNSGGGDAFVVKYNTSGIVQWVARVASTATDIGFAIATDSGGNVYLTGQGGSGAVVTAFSSDGVAFGTTSGGDAFVVKYNTSGIVQWVARVASTGTDVGFAIATDSGGNVYVTGSGGGATVTAFSSNGVAFGTTLTNTGLGDAFIVKYNTSGIVQWVAKVASSTADIGFAIATDSGGNVYVTGQGGAATVTAFSSNGVAFGTTLTNSGGGDAFIVKYNTSGIVQWVTRVASTTADIGYSIATDSSGNVYVGGQSMSTEIVALNSDRSTFSSINANGLFVVKYDTNGFGQWIQVASGLNASAPTPGSISIDSFGSAYLAGRTAVDSIMRIYNIDRTPYLFSNAGSRSDAFIVKYSPSAIPQWIARVDSTGGVEIGYGAATDSSGNIYMAGESPSGTATAFSSDGVAFGTTLPGSGGGDVFIVKYNTSGIVQWVAKVASIGTDQVRQIATDSSGNVYVTGTGGGSSVTAFSSNGVAFSPTISNSGGGDVFIVKYNTSGIVQWIARVASTLNDTGYAIATDSGGNVYVTGQGGATTVTAFSSNGVAFGTTLPSSGGGDVFIVKYNTSGIVQWIAKVASTVLDIGYSIATDSSGNVYVTGQSGLDTAMTAFSSNGVAFGTTLPNAGSTDAFIVKYNTSGIVQWVARVASTGADVGSAIATDSGGNIYLVGTYGGAGLVATAFSSNGVAFGTTLPNAGSTDACIVKYDTSGIVQWVARVASTGANPGSAIAIDSAGNLYVTLATSASNVLTAYNSDSTTFGSSGTNPVSGNPNDVYVVKYNSSGFVQWISNMGGSSPDQGYQIAVDPSSNFYVVGQIGGLGLVPFDAV